MLMNGKIGKQNKQNSAFLCLIQEPYVGRNCVALQPNMCKKYYIGKASRAIIYTDKRRDSWLVESLSTPDMAVIQTTVEGQDVLIASVYLDINNDDVITDEFDKLTQYAAQKGWGVLIGMDSNCQCYFWP